MRRRGRGPAYGGGTCEGKQVVGGGIRLTDE